MASLRPGLAALAIVALGSAAAAGAQDTCPCPPKPPDPAWKGSLGAGLALTGGNSDTRSYNVSFAASYDPKTRNSFKADGLYLRASTDGDATVDKSAAGARDEYKFGAQGFVFGEVRYLRDTFKNISYLVSPLAGVGWNAVNNDRTHLAFDAGVGLQFEKDKGTESTTDGAVQAAQRLDHKLSPNASLAERATALWKMHDFGDALYRVEISLSASIAKWTELRIGFADDYKTRPPFASIKKNDTSLLASLVFKIG